MPTLVDTSRLEGDLVIREWDRLYNRDDCNVKSPAAQALADYGLRGVPVKSITRIDDNHVTALIVLAGDEANATGVVIGAFNDDPVTLAANTLTPKRYSLMSRGPAVLNKDQLADDDPAGAAYNKDTLAIALMGKNIVCRAEPDQIEYGPLA